VKIVFRPEAQDDIREAAAWYERERSGLGLEFEAALDALVERIRDNPFQFPLAAFGTRNAILKRFPYSLRFKSIDGVAVVFACFHMSRNPRIWRRRARTFGQ
jgi:plasmid stabilization system protein ParE